MNADSVVSHPQEQAIVARTDFLRWMEDLGAVMLLLQQAPLQQRYPLGLMRTRLLASLWHQQYRLYWRDAMPVGFINWAWLSAARSEEYRATQCTLQAEDWVDGDHLWITEIIADTAVLPRMIQELRALFPSGQALRWHNVSPAGGSQYHELVLP